MPGCTILFVTYLFMSKTFNNNQEKIMKKFALGLIVFYLSSSIFAGQSLKFEEEKIKVNNSAEKEWRKLLVTHDWFMDYTDDAYCFEINEFDQLVIYTCPNFDVDEYVVDCEANEDDFFGEKIKSSILTFDPQTKKFVGEFSIWFVPHRVEVYFAGGEYFAVSIGSREAVEGNPAAKGTLKFETMLP